MHLLPTVIDADNAHQLEVGQHDSASILKTILSLLDVSEADFSPQRPFTSYGLDSLGATRISQVMRGVVNISQMQLLGGITWEGLEKRIGVSMRV